MANVHGTDISFYQDNPDTPNGVDFNRMAQVAGFTIIRIGQGSWADRDFAKNWKAAKTAGIPRGSYWFFDSRYDPIAQANLAAVTLGSDLGELPVFADYEESYGGPWAGWQNFKKFLVRLQDLLQLKEIGIYTGYYYWRDHSPAPGADLEWFKRFPLWMARYSSTIFPLPAPWTDWLFWQYTSSGDGAHYGCESKEVDLNYFNGDQAAFNARFLGGIVLPPPAGPYERFSVYGTTAHIWTIKPGRVKVTNDGFAKVSQTGTSMPDVSLVINGDGWGLGYGGTTRPNSICVSDGTIVQAQRLDYRPYFMFSKDTPSVVTHDFDANAWRDKITGPAYNTISGDRYLVKEWLWNSDISDRTTKDARTAIGIQGDNLVVIVADGNSRAGIGLTFPELAQLFIDRGCRTAINLDGGGSTAAWYAGGIVNTPNDDGVLGERSVINRLCFWFGDINPPPGGGEMYKCTVLLDTKERTQPNINGSETGRVFAPTETWETSYYNQVNELEAWVGTPSGNFTAQRYPRPSSTTPKVYVNVEEVVPPPIDPPIEPVVTHVVVIYDNGKISVDGGDPF